MFLLGASFILFVICMIAGGLAGDESEKIGKPAHSKAMADVIAAYKPPC